MGCCYSEPEPMNGGFNETKIKSQEEARRRYLSSTPSYSAGAGGGFFGWGTGAGASCGGGAA